MYKYINIFSISIFLTSIYILHANWITKKNKKNTMIYITIVTIVIYQFILITKKTNTNLLYYNNQILMILLILRLNLYKFNHNLKLVMNVNYILTLFPILFIYNYRLIEYDKLVLGYMLMSTVYMFSISIYNYNLSRASKAVLIFNLSYIMIGLIFNDRLYTMYIGSVLNLI